jgi:unsaturated chondroitin disaccharide hydrolase
MTRQGAEDESTWSRGQAWTMYGTILAYSYTQDAETLEAFKKTTAYFLEHLPLDYVPYWDFNYSDGDYEPRDSSAASIAVCALLEAIDILDEDDPLRETYIDYCNKIMNSLIENYTTKDIPASNGLLIHATQDKPGGGGIDETNLWGDYFYVEALNRMLSGDWEKYW